MIHRNGDKLFTYYFNAVSRKEELFDIRKDVHEQHNLFAETDADYVALLRKEMKEYLALHRNY
jgi:hypothetical protein